MWSKTDLDTHSLSLEKKKRKRISWALSPLITQCMYSLSKFMQIQTTMCNRSNADDIEWTFRPNLNQMTF